MPERAPDEADQAQAPDEQDARRDLRNVLVLALIDGELADEEKAYVDVLRQRAGLSAGEFKELCESCRQDPKRLSVPQDATEAEPALAAMVQLAVADGKVLPPERRTLRKVAAHVGMLVGKLDAMIAQAWTEPTPSDIQVTANVEEIYTHFAQWDLATRRRRVEALGDLGPPAARPLIQILESYRKPDGLADNLALKILIADQLGRLDDTRSVYYLAQHVSLGDTDDEISSFEFRAAAAEAIGKILGQGFSRDQEGIEAARLWWAGEGTKLYSYLIY